MIWTFTAAGALAVLAMVLLAVWAWREHRARTAMDADLAAPATLLTDGPVAVPAPFWAARPPQYTPAGRHARPDPYSATDEVTELLADTSVTKLHSAVIRGLDYRATIDRQSDLIMERICAQLTMADITTDLS